MSADQSSVTEHATHKLGYSTGGAGPGLIAIGALAAMLLAGAQTYDRWSGWRPDPTVLRSQCEQLSISFVARQPLSIGDRWSGGGWDAQRREQAMSACMENPAGFALLAAAAD